MAKRGNHIEKAVYFRWDRFLLHHIEIKSITGIDYNLFKVVHTNGVCSEIIIHFHMVKSIH